MKKIILILLILFCNSGFCQTKDDTESWLKSTIENFARRDVYYPVFNIYFTNGDIWLVELEEGGTYQRELPLKEISNIIIKSDANGYVLILGCKYSNTCCKNVHYKIMPDDSLEKVNKGDFDKTGAIIYLQKSLENEQMITRLKKAMKHLIQLNGGKVISDTF
jgi:hypothetical protein